MKKVIIALCAVGALSACSTVSDIIGKNKPVEESAPVVEKAPEEAQKISAVTPEQTTTWIQENVTTHDVFFGLKHGMEDASFKVDSSSEEHTALVGSTTLAKAYGNAQFAARLVEQGDNVKVVMAVTNTSDENAKTLMKKVRMGLDEYLSMKTKFKLPK